MAKKVTSVIWKFLLDCSQLDEPQEVTMPLGAKVVFAKNSNRGFKIWAQCNPQAKQTTRVFQISKTGTIISSSATYLGSYNSTPTYHIFELKRAAKSRGKVAKKASIKRG